MALEYGFTQQEKENYYQQDKVYSSFGRDLINDYVALYIYNIDNILLATKILSLDEVNFSPSGDFIDLDIGQHLRDLGFRQGDFNVTYKFLRRLAGRPRTVFVDATGIVFKGEVVRKVINGEVRYFQRISDEEKSNAEPIEVFIREQKYIINEASSDRREVKIQLDGNLLNQEYINDFKEMNSMIEYKPLQKDNGGLIKFDSKDQNVLEFDINPQDRGFTQNMVGGQIIIPNLYKVTGDEDTTNEDTATEPDSIGTLQQELEDGAATDFLDIDTEDLIQIMLNDPDPRERELADGALQERANEQR